MHVCVATGSLAKQSSSKHMRPYNVLPATSSTSNWGGNHILCVWFPKVFPYDFPGQIKESKGRQWVFRFLESTLRKGTVQALYEYWLHGMGDSSSKNAHVDH